MTVILSEAKNPGSAAQDKFREEFLHYLAVNPVQRPDFRETKPLLGFFVAFGASE